MSCGVRRRRFSTTGWQGGGFSFPPWRGEIANGYHRGYHETKLQENVDAEIFGVLIEEAKEAFDEEIVVELNSEKHDDVESNCERIATWVETWKKNQAENAD